MDTDTAAKYLPARLGNGTAIHLAEDTRHGRAIICNRWGSSNGSWKAPKVLANLTADDVTCKRCQALAAE